VWKVRFYEPHGCRKCAEARRSTIARRYQARVATVGFAWTRSIPRAGYEMRYHRREGRAPGRARAPRRGVVQRLVEREVHCNLPYRTALLSSGHDGQARGEAVGEVNVSLVLRAAPTVPLDGAEHAGKARVAQPSELRSVLRGGGRKRAWPSKSSSPAV
jgi:hypothetical protein